jgi:hypothetical protein
MRRLVPLTTLVVLLAPGRPYAQPTAIRRVPAPPGAAAATGPTRTYTNEAGEVVTEGPDGKPVRIVAPRNLLDAADDHPLDVAPLRARGLAIPGGATATAGALRAQGFVYLDRDASTLRHTSACRYEAEYASAGGGRRRMPWVLGCLTEPSVDVAVTPIGAGVLEYRYAIANGSKAEQSIFWFQLRLPRLDVLVGKRETHGWRLVDDGGVPLDLTGSEGADFMAFQGAPRVAPGGRLDGLALQSAYLPGVVEARFQGLVPEDEVAPPAEALPNDLEEAAIDLHRAGLDKVTRLTMGPAIAPPANTADRTRVVAALVADVARAEGGGLADAAGAARLRGLLDAVATNLDRPDRLTHLAREARHLRGLSAGYGAGIGAAIEALAAAA